MRSKHKHYSIFFTELQRIKPIYGYERNEIFKFGRHSCQRGTLQDLQHLKRFKFRFTTCSKTKGHDVRRPFFSSPPRACSYTSETLRNQGRKLLSENAPHSNNPLTKEPGFPGRTRRPVRSSARQSNGQA